MLSLNAITLRRGTRVLMENVDLRIHRKQRVGLTGANGTGKSSLIALIQGKITADTGDYSLQGNTTVAHVAQETPALDTSALDYVLDGDAELRNIQANIRHADSLEEHEKHSHWLSELERIDGYRAESRAAQLLSGLGFSNADLSHSVADFSGGWRMRLNLAQALMCRSDLLLLDEPTNHLDIDAILWLEQWLLQYTGALILVSHDRDFLDALCTHIAHIERQTLSVFTGNYSRFEQARAQQQSQQQAQYEKQQRQKAHMEDFVRRFRAKATKAKQAQSRLKALEKLPELAPAHADSAFEFSFFEPEKPLTHLLSMDSVDVGYTQQSAIIKNARFKVMAGDRVGLLGKNGAGKSTFIKTLAGDINPLSGHLEWHPDCTIGHFAQHQTEHLCPNQTPLHHIQATDEGKVMKEQEQRNYLGRFGFGGDHADSLVAPFSGGEKARLALALMVLKKPHILLLDEPTNHLDLEMRHALSVALQSFTGAIIVVSHDRHLLRMVCDELYLTHAGGIQPYEGDLHDYTQWLKQESKTTDETTSASTPNVSKKAQRQREAEKRKALKPHQDKLNALERTMDTLSERLALIEEKLTQEELYTNEQHKDTLQTLLKEQGQIKQSLDEAEESWLDAQSQLDQAKEQLA